jgi:hypothetical protein
MMKGAKTFGFLLGDNPTVCAAKFENHRGPIRTMQSPLGDCYPGADQTICLTSKSFYLHRLHIIYAPTQLEERIREEIKALENATSGD